MDKNRRSVKGPESPVTRQRGESRQSREGVEHPDCVVEKKLSLSLLVLARVLCSLLSNSNRHLLSTVRSKV